MKDNRKLLLNYDGIGMEQKDALINPSLNFNAKQPKYGVFFSFL